MKLVMMVLRHWLHANLHHCTQLTTLYLGYNKIGDDGAEAVAANIHHCTQLNLLGIAHNKIGDIGAKALDANSNHYTQPYIFFL